MGALLSKRGTEDAMSSEFIPFHRPAIGEEEIRSVLETLRSGWLTTGPKVKTFEAEFASYIGSAHAVAVNSATAAFHLALEAVGIKSGDEVIVPTMTFTATAEVVLYLGARPVLVDCRTDDLNIDVDGIEAAISNNTKAIVPVHIAGRPCAMDQILSIAQRYGLRVIEDAAHALPARHGGRKIGSIGDITCFSFYATKTITTGEGGMATTENPDWAERMRMMSLHGISHDAWNRYTKEGSWYYEVVSPGFKYNLTDLAAALGIEQLKKCDQFYEARKQIARRYDEAFRDIRGIQLPAGAANVQHAWHLYIIELELEQLRIGRQAFIEALNQHNVGTSVHFIPLHLHPFYRDRYGYKPEDFPNASKVFPRIISLPIYPGMTEANVDDVITAVLQIARENRR
jgi:dTDP-4-amino-4,6-dideoxygalactose transaminase